MSQKPYSIGAAYDGSIITEITDVDPNDDYQPFQYQLKDGRTVWIPAENDEGPQYTLATSGWRTIGTSHD